MQENYVLVQKGFRILLSSMSGYIGQELNRIYKNEWWDEVLMTLSDQNDLRLNGSYGELVDSLDVANCIRLIDRKWNEVFRFVLPMNCRTWAKELMGIRNEVSHIGQQDVEQLKAERALDTMALLCQEIDSEGAEEIRELYHEVRAKAQEEVLVNVEYTGLAQPETDSKRGALKEGSLLQLVGTEKVEKTTQTRKVTYGGKTIVYPVYKVSLDLLYYNDQNDRISTWISKYESEHGTETLNSLDTENYNRIIEEFICESNPEAIEKTKKNIKIVGQREPGVSLADGRIVDGNRRFTCLRKWQRETQEQIYFETVIMDMDIQEDRKQIKLLELAIQHGEEKKVDYDLIDYAVGTYRDIVQTKLLTVEEYASSTNETVGDVKKRIEIASVISEFLEYLKLPEQYHVAREYQVYSLFQEMMAPLRQLNDEEKKQLKMISFHNAMMKAMPDQRRFIRDIKGLIKNNAYHSFFEEQQKIAEEIQSIYSAIEVEAKSDVDKFAEEHKNITEELQRSMERALQKSRSQQLKAKPVEHISKCINLMMDIDARLFVRMDQEEKETVKSEIEELEKIVEYFKKML